MSKFQELLTEKENLENRLEEINKEFTEVAKEEFKTWAKNIFNTYDGLESISFTAYTPYFNDGDPCYFRSNHKYFSVNSDELEEFNKDNFTEEEAERLDSEITYFMDKFNSNDIKKLFGDHCKVNITKNGIYVDEYDHS
jgi:hypothetical protein